MLLPQLHEWFNARCVMLIRHPCAVVSSQLRWGSKVKKQNLFVPAGLFAEFRHLEHIFDRVESQEEVLAFEWAIQQLPALSYPRPYPWLITFYEFLYNDRTSQLARLCAFFDIDEMAIDLRRSYQPSRVTRSGLDLLSGNQLGAWKQKLDSNVVTRILDVVYGCGIDLYSDSELPIRSRAAELESNPGLLWRRTDARARQ